MASGPQHCSALPLKADMCGALVHVCFGPIADIAQCIRSLYPCKQKSLYGHRCHSGRRVVRSTPNLVDLIIDCVAKFLPYALNLLPRICAIFAFEREDIDYAKQAEEKDKTKGKLAHVNLSPQLTAEWLAHAAAFIERVVFCLSCSAAIVDRLSTKTRIAEDRLLLFRV